jgi:hypothetical protein
MGHGTRSPQENGFASVSSMELTPQLQVELRRRSSAKGASGSSNSSRETAPQLNSG